VIALLGVASARRRLYERGRETPTSDRLIDRLRSAHGSVARLDGRSIISYRKTPNNGALFVRREDTIMNTEPDTPITLTLRVPPAMRDLIGQVEPWPAPWSYDPDAGALSLAMPLLTEQQDARYVNLFLSLHARSLTTDGQFAAALGQLGAQLRSLTLWAFNVDDEIR